MKIGDLVKLSSSRGASSRAGLIVEIIDKKCWRTDVFGNKVDWNKVEPEPHAVVLINGDKRTIPVADLECLDKFPDNINLDYEHIRRYIYSIERRRNETLGFTRNI